MWAKQPWNCPACTYLNEDPAFRAACEICNTPRPSTVADPVGTGSGTDGGGERRQDDWDANEVLKSCGGGGGLGGGGGIAATASATMSSFSPAVPPAVAGAGPTAFASSVAAGAGAVAPPPQIEAYIPSGFSVGGGGGGDEVGGLPVGGIEVDDNEVDGILGGVSPGGGAFPVVSGADQAASGHCGGAAAASAAALGGSWEAGDEWEGFGSASFGQESPVNCSPRSAEAFEFSFGNSEAGAGGGGVGDGGGDGNHGRGIDNVEFGREGCAP